MSLALGALNVGQIVAATTIHVDRARLRDYAQASGDHNPIHQDEAFAASVGLPDVIAHGMWTMGAAIEVVTQWVGDPSAVLSYSTRFTKPVVVPIADGADIEVKASITKIDEATGHVTLDLAVSCAGEKVMGRAVAVVQGAVVVSESQAQQA